MQREIARRNWKSWEHCKSEKFPSFSVAVVSASWRQQKLAEPRGATATNSLSRLHAASELRSFLLHIWDPEFLANGGVKPMTFITPLCNFTWFFQSQQSFQLPGLGLPDWFSVLGVRGEFRSSGGPVTPPLHRFICASAKLLPCMPHQN